MDVDHPEQQPYAPPTPGRRAEMTKKALLLASTRVINTLDEKAMLQCFPQRWADEYPDLIPGLSDMVRSTYNEGVPLAWDDLCRSARFVEKANELDEIVEEAKRRKEAGEEPREVYKISTDGTITYPSLTVPRLRTRTDEIRSKREALASKNATTFTRISQLSQRAATQEAQNEAILESFSASVKALSKIDQSALQQLQDELVKVVGHDL
ncbi:hypothetical protein JCM8547_004045 [Rhodosporidiobolus lusitaniae]